MSARLPDHDGPLTPPPGEAEADASEVLDLDTRFGLSAFGPERPDERAGPVPVRPHGSDAVPASRDPDVLPEQAAPLPTPSHETNAALQGPSRPSRAPDSSEPQEMRAGVPGWHPAAPPQVGSPAHFRRWILPAAAAVIALAVTAGSVWTWRRPGPAPNTTGELTVDSTPRGARVIVGGTDRGSTPLSLSLAPGRYALELRSGDERHAVPVVVKAGATTAQHVFLREDKTNRGSLRVTSEPRSATVAVDGRSKGATPVLISDLPAGSHEVVVTGTSGSVRQRVHVDADATTTVMVPLPPRAAAQSTGGWLSITAPTELQVFEGDRLLGTTRVNPLMLPTGPHTLRLSSEAAGVDVTRQVTIERGKTARVEVALPPGTLSINAVPWAAVSIDGRDIGETPLGGVEVTPGPHVVVFTHPELGERRQQVTVRAGGAARVSMDLRKR